MDQCPACGAHALEDGVCTACGASREGATASFEPVARGSSMRRTMTEVGVTEVPVLDRAQGRRGGGAVLPRAADASPSVATRNATSS